MPLHLDGYRFGAVNAFRGHGFIDPKPGLCREYESAVDRLRHEMGTPATLRERWRFWRAKRRLWRDLVDRPSRSARW
jgi:hypothetical protein